MRLNFVLFIISLFTLAVVGFLSPNLSSLLTTSKYSSLPQSINQPINEPRLLSIPKLGINAQIEYVGLDKEGKMDVPKDVNKVAWYQLGFKPGERGNAVMAGHYDSKIGPAVFYRLQELEKGDALNITDKDGKDLNFEVEKKVVYDSDKVPLNDVFGNSDQVRLNLITCQGVFNTGTQNYSERLIIYFVGTDS